MSAKRHARLSPDHSLLSFFDFVAGIVVVLGMISYTGCGGGSVSHTNPMPTAVPGGTAPTPAPTATAGPTAAPAPSGSPAPTGVPTATPAPGTSPSLYTSNTTDHSISGFQIAPTTGSLSAVTGSPFSTGPVSADSLATDPQGRFLYAPGNTVLNCGNLCSGGIAEFSIDAATGGLTAISGSPVIAGSGFRASQVHPSGGFLYTVDINLNQVFGFTVMSTGALMPVPGSPFSTSSTESNGLAIHGAGQFLYVANSSGNSISAFQINSQGTLFELAESPFKVGAAESCPPSRNSIACGSAVAIAGNFLYYINGEAAENGTAEGNGIVGFTISPVDGILSPMLGPPFANPGTLPQNLKTTPDGRFLYVANVGSNNISAYSIDSANGMLTPVTGSPFAAGMFPLGMTTDPAGSFLYVTNVNSNSVTAYSIGSTGALTPVTGSPFATGGAPAGAAAAR